MPLPGDPDALLAASQELTVAAKSLQTAREGMAARGRTITADWSGRAAPAALEVIERHATDLGRAVEAVVRSAPPLATYAEELRAAQQDYARGEQMLQNNERVLADVGSGAAIAADTARDTAERGRDEAIAVMAAAKERAFRANEAAARAVAEAAVGLAAIVPRTATGPLVGATGPGPGSALAEAGNAAASVGNAALRNPASGLAVLGGGALATAGAVGALASVPLDATGVGAVAGVPLGAASLAAVTVGGSLAGAGLIDIARHAATDDRVAPFKVDTESEPTKVSASERITGAGEPGDNRRVRQVGTSEEVKQIFDELAAEGEPIDRGSYPGAWSRLPDGTEVGYRSSSRSGGSTVDAILPNGERWKIHVSN